MNSEIAKMLKYQEVDMKLYQLDRKLKNSDAAKAYMDGSAKKKQAKDELSNLNRDAEELMKSIEKNNEDFNSFMSQVNEVENTINENANVEELDYYIKKLDAITKQIEKLELTTQELKRKLDSVRSNADTSMKQYIVSVKAVNESKPKVEQMRNEMMGDAKKYNDELKEIMRSENIEKDSKVFALYNDVKRRRMPVFVEVNSLGKDSYNCGGCGVEIPRDIRDKVGNIGYAECPNCGRILYSKD